METITLDFTGCKYWGELHSVLKKGFAFPDYYGENWSALRDCLRYYPDDDIEVIIKGLSTLPKDFEEDKQIMLSIFNDVHEGMPNIVFKIIS